jgi:hypothetical protein
VGSTAGEQIDIRHYRNIAPGIGVTNNRGAISFDSPAGISTNGISVLPAPLFVLTNDPTGNLFTIAGYGLTSTFSSGVGVPALDVTQSARVGIGTTTPQEKLHIVGTTLFTGNTIITGNVGVGSTNPQEKLDIVGNTLVTGNSRVTSVGSTVGEHITIRHYRNIAPGISTTIVANNKGAISFDSPIGFSTNGISLLPASLFALTNDPTGNIFSVGGHYPAGSAAAVQAFNSGIPLPALDVTQSGRVGIGTTNPAAKLHIVGNTIITGITTVGLGSTSSPSVNSTMSFELTSDTNLRIKVKGTDGTLRSGNITLS